MWCSGVVLVAGVLFPEGLALMAAGPDLGALLAEVYPHRASFTHQQSCDLAVAAARQANSYRAMSLSCTLDTALRTSAASPGARASRPHRSSAPLVGLLLGRSDRSAGIETGFGYDVEVRLPVVLAGFLAGDISEQAARAYCEATAELPVDLARAVARDVLGDPHTVIPADIRDQIARLGIAADPGHAERVLGAALDKRDVCSARRPDGTADLTARHMPVEHAAASTATVSALVKAARRAGDTRPVGHLREQIAHGLLTRAYDGLTDAHIGALLAGDCPTRPVLHPDNDDPDYGDGDDPDYPGPGPDDPGGGPSGPGHPGPGPGSDGPVHDDLDSSDLDYGDLDYGDPDGPFSDPPPGPFAAPDPPLAHPGAGIDLRIDLATLLHHDENPAELARFGPVPAPVARHLTHTESAGQWRFALLDTSGHLLATGLLTTRPPGHRRRSPTNRATIEILLTTDELHVNLTTRGPTTRHADPAWTPLLTEIHRRTRTTLERPPPDPTRRFSDARLRRHITTRTPRCTWPHCREPVITSWSVPAFVDTGLGCQLSDFSIA